MENQTCSTRKRERGDRYDGFLLRGIDPFFVVIPHIMKARTGSMVFFEERVEVAELEKFIRTLRHESDMKNLSMLQVIMAATVRMVALHPGINRFIAGRKLYAHNNISLSISIKKNMSIEGAETTVKPIFTPQDTLHDVWEKVNAEFTANKTEDDNGTDHVARLLTFLPVFFVKFVVFLLWNLDKVGFMPKIINEVSPFHASGYIVDIGSIGIGSVYHHLYDFGTCSFFISVGRKENTLKTDKNGNQISVKTMNIKVAVDERICDGYYFAKTFRDFRKLIRNPEQLLVPPENVPADPWLLPTREERRHR